MIKAETTKIDKFLSGMDTEFIIPKFQRGYDWGENQTEELLQDLADSILDDSNLFLGSILINEKQDGSLHVVDGQQRLTTISILLVALRRKFHLIGEPGFASKLHQYICTGGFSADRPRMKVSENIRDMFEYITKDTWDGNFPDEIDGKSVKKQKKKLKKIYDIIFLFIDTYNAQQLAQFVKKLLASEVIEIKVTKNSEVYAIFERTNARGLDLNISDLLKNLILSHEEDEYEDKWYEIIENAGTSLQRMLKYFWVSRKGSIRKSEVYKSLRDYAKEITMIHFIDELYEFSRFYKTFNNPEFDDVTKTLNELELFDIARTDYNIKEVARRFQALKLFNVTQVVPMVFAILKSYKAHNGTKKNLLMILKSIECFHFKNSFICKQAGNQVEKLYSDFCKRFHSEEMSFNEKVDLLMHELRKKTVTAEEFHASFSDILTYKNKSGIHYFYDRLNNHKVKGGQYISLFEYDRNKLQKSSFNIEHIQPQSKKKDLSTEEEVSMIDSIGNLVIISMHTNSELSNKDPKEKLEMLKEDSKHASNLRYLNDLVKELERAREWDISTINERTKRLSEKAYKDVWSF